MGSKGVSFAEEASQHEVSDDLRRKPAKAEEEVLFFHGQFVMDFYTLGEHGNKCLKNFAWIADELRVQSLCEKISE